MPRNAKIILVVIGILLLILGFGNIWDDSRVLVYDLTAILSGIGFITISRINTERKWRLENIISRTNKGEK